MIKFTNIIFLLILFCFGYFNALNHALTPEEQEEFTKLYAALKKKHPEVPLEQNQLFFYQYLPIDYNTVHWICKFEDGKICCYFSSQRMKDLFGKGQNDFLKQMYNIVALKNWLHQMQSKYPEIDFMANDLTYQSSPYPWNVWKRDYPNNKSIGISCHQDSMPFSRKDEKSLLLAMGFAKNVRNNYLAYNEDKQHDIALRSACGFFVAVGLSFIRRGYKKNDDSWAKAGLFLIALPFNYIMSPYPINYFSFPLVATVYANICSNIEKFANWNNERAARRFCQKNFKD